MDLKLKDKAAIVTGAGSQIGYGKGIALTLAKEGCDIVVADMNLEGAEQTAAEVKALGRKAMAIKADVANRTEVDDMVKKALAEFGKIDILVNNAGATSGGGPFAQSTKETWDFDINVNLYGQMNTVHAVVPHMIERKYGKIVNFSGGQGMPGASTYGAAKAGVVAFTSSIAKELAPQGIIVNCFGPGPGDTGLGGDKRPPGLMENIKQRSVLKKLCTPEDVGRAISFLVSDANSYMVGKTVQLGTT